MEVVIIEKYRMKKVIGIIFKYGNKCLGYLKSV